MRFRTLLATLALALGAMLMVPAVAAADSAPAANECNSGHWRVRGSAAQFIPEHLSGSFHDFTCQLRRGDFNNWGVVALQNTLIKCYGQRITRDGDFGIDTENALKNAQRIHRIDDDGIYGWVTHTTVFWPTYLPGAGLDDAFRCVGVL